MGLDQIDPATFADIIVACDSEAATAATANAAGSTSAPAAPLATIVRMLVDNLQPMAPAALLTAGRLAAATAESPAGSRAPTSDAEGSGDRARRLLQLLLRSCAGASAAGGPRNDQSAVITLGDGIAHALWQVALSKVAVAEQRHFIAATARVLCMLPPAELSRAAKDMIAAANQDPASSVGELCSAALVEAAEMATEVQAFALICSPLPERTWEAVWSVLISPVRGTFCPSERGLAAALALIPGSDRHQLNAAWGALLAHRAWADVGAELRASASSAAGASGTAEGVDIDEVLSSVLQRLPLPAGAAHVAAVAGQVSANRLAQMATRAMGALERTAYGESSVGAVAWLYALRQLHAGVPALADAPRALRTFCVAASALDAGLMPAFMRAAAHAAGIERRRRDGVANLRVMYECMAYNRNGDDLQILMRDLAAKLPAEHAEAMQSVLANRMTPPTRDAIVAAATGTGKPFNGFEGESIWQMGQRWEASPAVTTNRPSSLPAGGAAAASPPSWPTTGELARLISQIPHAPRSEDAMHDPERVARLMRQVMALLSNPTWRPGREEAAAAAALLGELAAKRGWGDGDLAGLLCRLPAPATLRLLMVADAADPVITKRRPALLAALARWHGAAALTEQVRIIYCGGERGGAFALGDVLPLLADVQDALDGAATAAGQSGGFVAAVVQVLGDLRGAAPLGAARHQQGYAAALLGGTAADSEGDEAAGAVVVVPAAAWRGGEAVTAGDLADLICIIHALAPDAAARALLRAVGASFDGPALSAVGAALPGAMRRTLGKGASAAAEVAAIMGCEVDGGEGPHAVRAGANLRAAAGSGGSGEHADKAAAALRAAAGDDAADGGARGGDSGGRNAHEKRAEAALKAAAATGGGGGTHASRAEAALLSAAAESSASADPATEQLREVGNLVKAQPSTDPIPYLRRAMRGGAVHILLHALPKEARSLPLRVIAPLLALAISDAEVAAADWELALVGACAAADSSGGAAPSAFYAPLSRRAYVTHRAASRYTLLRHVVESLQQLSRPNRETHVGAYAAILRTAAAAADGDYEPTAALLGAMVDPPPPTAAAQRLGASGAARLAALLLSGSDDSLRAMEVILPMLGRAYTGASDASSWFVNGLAVELPKLPVDRAALGLTLLQPALASVKALKRTALAVAAVHGREATVAALEVVWFQRHAKSEGSAISEAASNDVIWELRSGDAHGRGDADGDGGKGGDGGAAGGEELRSLAVSDKRSEGEDAGKGQQGCSSTAASEGAGVALLGIASLAVAARLASRVFGVGRPAGRMLFGSLGVLGATVSVAALLTELLAASGSENGGGDSSD